MKWDPSLYERQHGFVAEYGKALLHHLPQGTVGAILDVGCGTGALTPLLKAHARRVLGIDHSPEMIQKAKLLHPSIEFAVMDACALPFVGVFDVVFSNAVFHWILEQPLLLKSLYRALKPGGSLIAEFGADGNVERIRAAMGRTLASFGREMRSLYYFPTCAAYHDLLTEAGYEVLHLRDFDRPTPLKGGFTGLGSWVRQFYAAHLEGMRPAEVEQVISLLENSLKATCWDGEAWTADYRRIRVVARRPEGK